MLAEKVVHQQSEFRKAPGHRKEHALFGNEVTADLVLITLLDFYLPDAELNRFFCERTIDPHTKSEGMLVLARKGDQAWVAKHGSIIHELTAN